MRQIAIQTCSYNQHIFTQYTTNRRTRNILRHIESQLPSIMYLPISSDDTLHFYQYLITHILIVNGQFLLITEIPIQDRLQQLQIAGVITKQPYSTCLHANRQFCLNGAPFQPLINPPSCIAALYTRNYQEIGAQCSLSIFHTPPTFTPITITVPMICPDKLTSSMLFQQPFYILHPKATTSL